MEVAQEYFSCPYIQNGISFYPNNTIKMCCFTDSPDVDICQTDENIEIIVKKILDKKQQMIEDFAQGKIYDCCKNCASARKANWGFNLKQIISITLNHYMACNLKCTHCGYWKEMEVKKLLDTNHETVLNIIKMLIATKLVSQSVNFDVGGGEPSLSKGLIEIVKYCIDNNHHVHINSNGAAFVQLFAEGANKGLINLTLTPDAGSQEVYTKIKGADYFHKTWDSIRQYMEVCPRNVNVKFILEEGNVNDVENMVEMCVKNNVRDVILNFDLNIPKQNYVLYFDSVNKFRMLCRDNNINLFKGPFIPNHLWMELPTNCSVS